jgi:hypothetical protein
MNVARITILAALACVSIAVPASGNAGGSLSLGEYIAELQGLSTSLNKITTDPESATVMARSLPPQWTVKSGDLTFQIDNNWLKAKLEEAAQNPSDPTLSQLRRHLAMLASAAEASQPPARDVSYERQALKNILARREFRNVHGLGWWDRVKGRILRWVAGLLTRAVGSTSFGNVGRYFIWALVAAAVLALAVWTFRTLRRNAGIETLLPEALPVSAKQWAAWMAEAQTAAADGRWRDAIHLGYWAGISFLEERGTWHPDQARTPREYLRLISPSSEYRSALSTLTGQFEVVWYGYKEGSREAFSETLAHLETLGCRLS